VLSFKFCVPVVSLGRYVDSRHAKHRLWRRKPQTHTKLTLRVECGILRLSCARSISGPFQRLALQSNELVSKGEYRLSIQLCLCEASSPFTKEHVQIIDFKFLSDTTFCLATWFWKELRSTGHKGFSMCLGPRGKSYQSVMFLRVIVSNLQHSTLIFIKI